MPVRLFLVMMLFVLFPASWMLLLVIAVAMASVCFLAG